MQAGAGPAAGSGGFLGRTRLPGLLGLAGLGSLLGRRGCLVSGDGASFHPQFQFEGTAPDDITNYTNRAPYPMLHLLREDSVERAVAAFPDELTISETNIVTLEKLGSEGWKALGI